MLTAVEKMILDEIIDKEGKCLKNSRCRWCPLRWACLPMWVSTKPPSKKERKDMALELLTNEELLADGDIEYKDR